jgi:WD40 repeat protein
MGAGVTIMRRVFLLGLCVAACLFSATSVASPQGKAAPKKQNAERKDADGFPLPPGAVARLGTLCGVDEHAIGFLALSADGKRVATVPEWPNDPTLRIREVPSGKLLQEVPLNIKFWENMALSPNFETLAWTYLDNSVTLVNLATRKETIVNPPTEKDARGVSVSFSADGKKIVATFKHHYSTTFPTKKGDDTKWLGMFDFEIVEWTLADGKRRQLWKDEGNKYPYRNVAFAPDAKTLAYIKKKSARDVAEFEQEFVLEDAARKPRLKLPLKDGVDCLMAFSPDGNVLALADEDSLKLVDITEAKVRWTASYKGKIKRPESRWSSPRYPWPEKIVWFPGGDIGLFFHADALWTWKISDGKPSTNYSFQATKRLALARDASVLAFTQDGRSLQFFDITKGKALQPVEGHRNPPSVLFRNDGTLISHDERKICMWNGTDWRFRNSFEFHDKGQRFYFGNSQDFFVRTVGKKVEARSLMSGDVMKEWTLKSAADFVYLLPDGKTLAAGYLYQSEEAEFKVPERLCVRLLDTTTGTQKEIPLPYQPWQVKASPAKPVLAFRHHDDARNYLDILDIDSGKRRRVMDDKTNDFELVDFALDGRSLYLSSVPADSGVGPRKMTLASLDVASGKIATHGKPDRVREASLSADGRFVVYSPYEVVNRIIGKHARVFTTPSNKIVVWEPATSSERTRFDRTNAWVKGVSCAPDRRYFATGLYDSTIVIWDIEQLGDKK